MWITVLIKARVFMKNLAADQPIDRRQSADETKSGRKSRREASVKWLVSTDGELAEMLLESMKFGFCNTSSNDLHEITLPSKSPQANSLLCGRICFLNSEARQAAAIRTITKTEPERMWFRKNEP